MVVGDQGYRHDEAEDRERATIVADFAIFVKKGVSSLILYDGLLLSSVWGLPAALNRNKWCFLETGRQSPELVHAHGLAEEKRVISHSVCTMSYIRHLCQLLR